jgi:transposase InsO family protein
MNAGTHNQTGPFSMPQSPIADPLAWRSVTAPSLMARGFVYLAVVLDWFSRRVLSWRVSITMEAAFCIETLEDALARHGKPDIFNTDQGSQFTGTAFTGVLIKTLGITLDDPTLNVIRELKITAPPNGAVIVKVDPRCRSPRGPQIR